MGTARSMIGRSFIAFVLCSSAFSAVAAPPDDISGIENISTTISSTVLKSTRYGTGGPVLHFDDARGTQESPSEPQSGDTILSIGARAYNSTYGFSGSSAAIVCKTIENTGVAQAYTASYCTLGTTPAGSARQDWFYFGSNGNFTSGGMGDPNYSGGHSISVQSGSAVGTFELLTSAGVPQGSLDLVQNQYLWLGTRSAIPLYLAANSAVGITVGTTRAIRFNSYGAGAIISDAEGNLTSQSGVSCSGAPSSSFQVTNGIVVHC